MDASEERLAAAVLTSAPEKPVELLYLETYTDVIRALDNGEMGTERPREQEVEKKVRELRLATLRKMILLIDKMPG